MTCGAGQGQANQFHFEAEIAAFPIVASRWELVPEDARVFFQNEKSIQLYGDLQGRLLIDLISEVIRESCTDQRARAHAVMQKLLMQGHVKHLTGALAGKKVEFFSCLQEHAPNTIQTTIFDITASFMDHLSGIPGRELFYDYLETELLRASRERGELHVCFLDLDGFKQTNDLFGHKAGDAVIVEVARRLRHLVRRHEKAARLGGDEFVLMLSGERVDSRRFVETKLIPAINEPYDCNGHVVDFVGVSVGIAYAPLHGWTSDELVNHADDAMYVAKERGKNQVVIFESGMAGMKKHQAG